MKIFYFEITPQYAATTVVAIFAKNAERASTIFGLLMLNIERYEPPYSGAGLALFQQSVKLEPLVDALSFVRFCCVKIYCRFRYGVSNKYRSMLIQIT